MTKRTLEGRLRAHFEATNDPLPPAGIDQRIVHSVFDGGHRRRTWPTLQILTAAGLIVLALGVAIGLRQSHGYTPLKKATPTPTPTVSQSPTFALPPQFRSLHMVSEQIGWADTDEDILRTTDGGMRWQNVTPAWARGLTGQSYSFLDAQRAWFAIPVMQSGSPTNIVEVGWTSDGGHSWERSQPIRLRWPGDPYYLTFLDPTHGWLLASDGGAAGSQPVDVFATRDGGANWTETSYGDFQGSTPGALPFGCDKFGFAFISSLTGWATGACNGPSPFFMVTHDGGRTWSDQPIPNPGTQLGEGQGLGIPMIFSSRAAVMPAWPLMANKYGTLVYVTTDGGKAWSPEELPALAARDGLETFFALDIDHWWVMSRDGTMVDQTSDRGRHWQQNQTNLPSVDGLTVDFVSPQVGFAGGTFGGQYAGPKLGLYKTLDGGVTWHLVPTSEVGQ